MNLVKHSKRDLVNAVLYLVKTGCQWRVLPNDLPNYVTVWSFYRRAVIAGKWEQAMALLVEKTRVKARRNPITNLRDHRLAKYENHRVFRESE